MSIETRVNKILAKHLGVQEDQIKPENRLDDLGADSLDALELVMALEDEFGISITDEEGAEIETVGGISALIEKIMNR